MKLKDIKRKNRNKKIILTIAMIFVMAMGVGYAYLRDSLTLENNAKMSMTWNVYFDNVQKLGNSIDPATTPTLNKTSFNTTLNFTDTSQIYMAKFDVKNEGSFDAMITSYTANPLSSELQSYFDVAVTYGDGIGITNNDLLAQNATDSFKIKVSIKNGVNISQIPSSVPVSFTVNYGKADSNAAERQRKSLVELPQGKTKDTLAVGDEICIDGDTRECFNFVRYDGANNEDIVMLAKWNLNVGNKSKGTETFLQDSDVKGNLSSGTAYGTVTFSATNYWDDGTSLKTKYGNSWNTNNIYDSDYITKPDFTADGYNTENYSIAYYVEKYKEILTGYGLSVKDSRLLTFEEATDSSIGCSTSDYVCPSNSFIKGTSFWLGSVETNRNVWYVYGNDASFYSGVYYYATSCGVRPVIVISKSIV
jgi:hypothetical protein